jgi:hypothetical protein
MEESTMEENLMDYDNLKYAKEIKELEKQPDTKNNSGTVASYVAIVETSEQIAEDHWRVFTATKICTKETTLGELDDWIKTTIGKNVKLSCEISTAT